MTDLKVTAEHLRRDAYLYVRQSTLRQVAENVESTQRQYVLRDRAVGAGWPAERIHVIDNDLGKSGSAPRRARGLRISSPLPLTRRMERSMKHKPLPADCWRR